MANFKECCVLTLLHGSANNQKDKKMELKEYFKEEPKGAINEMAGYLGVSPTWLSLIIHGHRVPSPKLAV